MENNEYLSDSYVSEDSPVKISSIISFNELKNKHIEISHHGWWLLLRSQVGIKYSEIVAKYY